MNFFILFSSFLAVVAVDSGNRSSSRRLIAKKWAIPEPSLEFHRDDSIILLKYDSNNNNNNNVDVQENHRDIVSSSISMWSKECRSGGGTEIKLEDDSAVTVENAVVGIALDRLWSDLVEHENDYPGAVFDETASATTGTTRTIGFCVRYALSARTIIVSENENNHRRVNNEMNFVESVVTATIVTKKKEKILQQHEEEGKGDELTSFEVIAATIAPVPQQEDHHISRLHQQTFYHNQNHTIEAFLCPNGGDDNTPIVATVSQGSVVTLCVQTLIRDGSIRVASIEEFTWTKRRVAEPSKLSQLSPAAATVTTVSTSSHNNNNTEDNSTMDSPQTATMENRRKGVLSSNSASISNSDNDDGSIIVRQEAIRDGAAVGMFTVYNGCRDRETSFCSISTLLMPKFYNKVEGRVSGTGTLSLAFGTKGEKDKRNFSYDP